MGSPIGGMAAASAASTSSRARLIAINFAVVDLTTGIMPDCRRPALRVRSRRPRFAGVRRRALLISLLLTGLSGPARAAVPGAEAMLPVGSPAPEVVGTDAKGTTFKLSAQKGRYAIVYF